MSSQAVSSGRPRRLLSIDGGGLCGLIPAQSLIEMEQQLDRLTGDPQPLGKRFDLIGGTSTGAILAAGLALGKRAEELSGFYEQFGPDIFHKVSPLEWFWHKYSSDRIENHLKDVLGLSTKLGDASLCTKILLTAKNATLGNDWFFTNNPTNKFFDTNKNIPLWEVVRASSAAPTYFPPHTIKVPDSAGQPQAYEFIDGGVSSYNNPSLQVFLEATMPEYGIGWPMGVDDLLLISLGTGYGPVTIEAGKAAGYELLDWATYVLKELMNEANLEQNILMGVIGQRPSAGLAPDSVGTSGAVAPAATEEMPPGAPSAPVLDRMSAKLGGKLLTYQRITIGLTRERLDNLGLVDIDPVQVREMDAVDQIANMKRVGVAVAQEQVHMDRLLHFFQTSGAS